MVGVFVDVVVVVVVAVVAVAVVDVMVDVASADDCDVFTEVFLAVAAVGAADAAAVDTGVAVATVLLNRLRPARVRRGRFFIPDFLLLLLLLLLGLFSRLGGKWMDGWIDGWGRDENVHVVVKQQARPTSQRATST